MKFTDLQKVAVDLYRGNTASNFSTREAEEILREEISNLISVNGKPSLNKFRENKYKVYALLEEVFMPVTQPYQLPAELQSMIRVERIADNEVPEFTVDDPALFKVYKTSDGNIDIRRQTVAGDKVTVSVGVHMIKIYAELSNFLTGRIDWVGMINKVNASFDDFINRSMASLFDGVANPIKTATGTFDADKLADLIDEVETKYGTGAVIYGKKSVLGKVQDVVQSERSKEDFNSIGYYGQFRGTPMIEIPTSSTELVILPYAGSPLGLVVIQGNPLVLDTGDFGTRNDLQMEFVMGMRLGFVSVDIGGATYTIA